MFELIAVITEKVLTFVLVYISYRLAKFSWKKSINAWKRFRENEQKEFGARRKVVGVSFALLFCVSAYLTLGSFLSLFKIPNKSYSKDDIALLEKRGESVKLCGMGGKYLFGIDVKRDYLLAKKYFAAAAKHGDQNSQCLLGAINLGEKNYEEAEKLFESALNPNKKHASNLLNQLDLDLEKFSFYFHNKRMFKVETDKVLCEAFDTLAWLYLIGEEVPQNREKAITYFKKSAELGNKDALYRLGLLYLNGTMVAQDTKTALSYLNQAADKGDSLALLELGFLYFEGFFVKENLSKARRYLSLAAATDGNAKKILEALDDPIASERMKKTARLNRETMVAKSTPAH